ncbi:MAG: nitrile hydratase subunit alpha [Chloroflexi bacterium]|nr:nitrile hydratase subunit alpha [Chloroflexota bacterium]
MSGNHPSPDPSLDGPAHANADRQTESNVLAGRVQAIEALLIERGVVTPDEVQRTVDWLDDHTPAVGARLVARAWVDPAFKARLLADPRVAAAELGIDTGEVVKLVVVENTADVHHLVVCTFCSCSPRGILGPPPDWYKSLSYRARAVVDPRGVMREFGLELGGEVEVRVQDTTTEVRYLVLPRRPAGTDHLAEPELAELVTWESMIGVAELAPAA